MNFRIETFFNPYLSPDTRRVDAVISVTAGRGSESSMEDETPVRPRQEAMIGLVVDMSGSMQGEREQAAKYAVRRAIALLDATTHFFVIQFSTAPSIVFGPAPATSANRALADEAVRRIGAGGGTYMSRALSLARDIFHGMPGAIHYCLFLTDGKNSVDDAGQLQRVLETCDGVFECDCRGVGTDWATQQLRLIAGKLLGTADIIPEPDLIEADFARAIRGAMTRAVSDVRLRLWTPKSVKILACKLVSPRIEPLLERGVPVGGQATEFPTGAWSPETRDYYVAFSLPNGDLGEDVLACRPSLVYGSPSDETRIVGGNISVSWTNDASLSEPVDAHVAHYVGQQELTMAIEVGLAARQRGDVDLATKALGKAVRIAHASGNDEVTLRLVRVVEILDAPTGTIRLKSKVEKADEMDLDLASTRTARVQRER